MSREKRLTRELVHVVWFDACIQHEQIDETELDSEWLVETSGIFVRETKAFMVLAMDRTERLECWRHVIHIPKANILSVQRFKLTVAKCCAPK